MKVVVMMDTDEPEPKFTIEYIGDEEKRLDSDDKRELTRIIKKRTQATLKSVRQHVHRKMNRKRRGTRTGQITYRETYHAIEQVLMRADEPLTISNIQKELGNHSRSYNTIRNYLEHLVEAKIVAEQQYKNRTLYSLAEATTDGV